MRNIKTITTLFITMLAIGLVFTACKKDKETEENTPSSVTNQELHVTTGEIAVTKTEDDFSNGNYDATIGDKQTIASFSNGNLYFLVPELESGDYVLSINYHSDILNLNLKVTKSENIENPSEYLSNVDADLKNYFTNNIQNIESELEAGLIKEVLANEQIAYWNAQENKFSEELAKLSNNEKQDFANFLESNKLWIDELRNYMVEEITNSKKKLTCLEYRTQALNAKNENRLFAYAWFTLRYKQCRADQAPNPPASLGQFVYTYSFNFNWMISIWDTYVEPIFKNIEQQLNGLNSNMVAESIEDDKNKSVSTFANNTPQELAYHIKFRSVNESDADGPFSHVVGVIGGFIDFIESVSDEFSNFIGIDVSFSNTSITQPFNRGMSIMNISNANVSLLSSEIVDDKWEVAFKSTGVGEQEFTFDVWYNDDKVEFGQRYDAILTVPEPYSIEILSGNNQSGELGEQLEEPIEVLVKDEEGNPFEGALVTFEVSEGSVSNNQNITNAQGIANTNWTLSTNNDEQELIAKVFESDGVTVVQGSPLVFTGNTFDYKLQIGDNDPDFSQINVVATYENGDIINLPNYMNQMVRLTLNGIPVAVGGYGLEWTIKLFGVRPTSNEDIHESNYSVIVYDATNRRDVTLTFDITLSNQAYRRITDQQITCDLGDYGVPRGEPQTISFSSDGTYTKTYPDGSSAGTGSYSFYAVTDPSWVNCDTYIIRDEKAGCIHLPSEAGNVAIPKYIYIYKDNTMGANSSYGCMNGFHTWHFN